MIKTKEGYLNLIDSLKIKANSDLFKRFFVKHYEIEYANSSGREVSTAQFLHNRGFFKDSQN